MTQLNEHEMKLVELISEGCKTPNDITSKLKQLFAGTLEKMLEAEMDEHLGYEKNSILGNNRNSTLCARSCIVRDSYRHIEQCHIFEYNRADN